MSVTAIKLENINKKYYAHNKNINVLKNFNYDFEYNKVYGIIGRSGCGKSTLLKIIGLIDNYDSGNLYINGELINNLSYDDLAKIRNEQIGFIFQDYLLDDNLNVIDNIMLPIFANRNNNYNNKKKYARSLLRKYNLEERINHYPKELSGGEAGRTAIIRALINNPNIILADEPTGNLDKETEKKILGDLKNLASKDRCVIIVSHSSIIKNYVDILIDMENIAI